MTAAREQQLLQQFCYSCHSERAKAAGLDSAKKLTLDTLDTSNVARDARTWELVARKLRAGMMPPTDMRRPDPVTYESMSAWIESELDRDARSYTPPPGLHRLNRTEYANSIRDLLDLPIDPAKYLPSDDSTSGFDNIAGALGISSTLVEAYVTAAQKISRLALGEPEDPGLVVYRPREAPSQDHHGEGLPLATQYAPLLDLDKHFRRSTIQTGPTPGYTFFPHVGTIRVEGPFAATHATNSPSRRALFICKPARPADEEPCARRIVEHVASGA